jgi:hypothetical protein
MVSVVRQDQGWQQGWEGLCVVQPVFYGPFRKSARLSIFHANAPGPAFLDGVDGGRGMAPWPSQKEKVSNAKSKASPKNPK